MREFMNVIRESIEFSTYGYWITPQGEVISCSRMSHGEAAAAMLGTTFDEHDEVSERAVVNDAIEIGAVRVVAQKGSDEFSAEWSDMAITDDSKRALLSLMELYQDRTAYVLGDEWFDNYRAAVKYVRAG
jgi:hypothetical protein